MKTKQISRIVKRIKNDPKIRRAVCKKSLLFFFLVYFRKHIDYKTALFQRKILKMVEQNKPRITGLISFRGSGKSTLITTCYAIWSIIGPQNKKFVVLVSKTQDQARRHLANIRRELEKNRLLDCDFNLARKESPWTKDELYLPAFNATIIAISNEKGVRGIKHGSSRPDLVILDDIEDMKSVRTQESRDKLYEWVAGDVLPIGSKDTKFIFVGNLLHNDSVMMRIKTAVETKKLNGVFKQYPFYKKNGQPRWTGKFPNEEAIEREKQTVDFKTWKREYELEIVPEGEPPFEISQIRYYSNLPEGKPPASIVIGVDPASSERENSSYTAMVPIAVLGSGENLKLFVLDKIINERMRSVQIREKIRELHQFYKAIQKDASVFVIIEKWGAFDAIAEELKSVDGIEAEAVFVGAESKTQRLEAAASLANKERLFFPEGRANELINQLLGAGIEKYSDMADALSLAINWILKNKEKTCENGVFEYIRQKIEETKEMPHGVPQNMDDLRKLHDQYGAGILKMFKRNTFL